MSVLHDHDRLSLRGPQERLAALTVERCLDGQDTTIGLLATGAGKTLGWVATYIVGCRAEAWDRVLVLSPRLNLATQGEVDYREWAARFAQPRPRPVVHRTNDVSVIPRGASGSISTYQSLVSKPERFTKWAVEHDGRFLLVLDEAQFLGDDGNGDATKAAEVVTELAALAAHTLVLTGTPYRSDEKPLTLCEDFYVPAGGGTFKLDAHVEALYQDCVEDRTLRRFQADLVDGTTRWEERDRRGNLVKYDLPVSALGNDGLVGRALRDERVWRPIVDLALSRLDEVKERTHDGFAALVAAMDVAHARDLYGYIVKAAPHLRTVIAVSADGDAARSSLRRMQAGDADVLVSVRQAYIGYDHKPLTVVASLTHYRHHGHLEQLVGRALRVWAEVPYDEQTCYVVGPADIGMRKFAETMRTHSDTGALRVVTPQVAPATAQRKGSRVVDLDDAALGGGRVYGSDRDGSSDLTADDAAALRRLMVDRGIDGVSETQAAKLLRAAGDLDTALAPYRDAPDVGESARYGGMALAEARKQCNKEVSGIISGWLGRRGVDPRVRQVKIREVHAALNKAQGVRSSTDIVDPSMLDDRRRLALEYIAQRGG